MVKPSSREERWEDPIVAEVRKAREELFAAAGYNLEELCRRLREQQRRERRGAVTRPRKPMRGGAKSSSTTRKKSIHPEGRKGARR